jgi:hypothetical protein
MAQCRRRERRRWDACGPAPRIAGHSVNATVNDVLIASSPSWSTQRRDHARRSGLVPPVLRLGPNCLTLALFAAIFYPADSTVKMMSNGSMMPGFVPNATSTPRMPFAIHELLGLTGHPSNGTPQSSPNFGVCRPELPTPTSTLVHPYHSYAHHGTPQGFGVPSSTASTFPFQHQSAYHSQQNAFHSNHFLAGLDPATAAAMGFGQRSPPMGQQPMLQHDMSNGESRLLFRHIRFAFFMRNVRMRMRDGPRKRRLNTCGREVQIVLIARVQESCLIFAPAPPPSIVLGRGTGDN